MSWAEIKKAVNSNLDVPLNEYLGGSYCLTRIVSSGVPTNNTPITVLSMENIPILISGIYIRISFTGGGQEKCVWGISLDDGVVLDSRGVICSGNVSASAQFVHGIGSLYYSYPNYLVITGNGSQTSSSLTALYHDGYLDNVPSSSLASGNNYTCISDIGNKLLFSNKFKIEAKATADIHATMYVNLYYYLLG